MDAPEKSGRWRGLAALAAVLGLVAVSTAVRVETALRDPNFDTVRAEGMLKSDPALLYYVTERILENGGLPPADFRADPRVQHPDLTDIPAEFTVGQEFLVAWVYRAFGRGMPLHVFCVVFFSILASLAALGVYGLARELTRSRGWGLFAALLWLVLPASYRTIGFILVREDLSFPLFAIHLWLLARAWRVGSARAWLLAGLFLAGALATWHAMVFLAAIEAGGAFLWFLRRGGGSEGRPRAAALLVFPIVAAVLVPAMGAAGLATSLPLALGLALVAASFPAVRRRCGRGGAVGLALLVALAVAGLGFWASAGAYAHVREVLVAKVLHLGAKPADPTALSFDARLLWQGPFETLTLVGLWGWFGWALVPTLATLPRTVGTWRRGERAEEGVLFAVLWASLAAAWLVERVVILPGALAPVAIAVVLARLGRPRVAVGVAVVLLLLQGQRTAAGLHHHRIDWYLPPGRQTEIAALVEWVDANLPPEAAIVGDFMNSTALLAHTRRRIVLQPKYETDRSRRRAQAFYETFFHGTPADLARLVREGFHSDYLLVDRYTLHYLSTYLAGVGGHRPPSAPGTAAAAFLSQDAEVLTGVEGFELLYRSPPTIRQGNGEPYDFFRVYRVGGG